MKKICIFLLCGLLSATGCSTLGVGIPLYSPTENVAAVSNSFSADDVRTAILHACKEREWTTHEAGKNLIDATLKVRGGKHVVEVRITYSASQYTIAYKGSQNMDHHITDTGGVLIHPNYNKWVALLENNINKRLEALRTVRS